jgi:hypothetical protein
VLPPEEIERGDWFEPATVDRWLAERPGDFAGAFPVVWAAWDAVARRVAGGFGRTGG